MWLVIYCIFWFSEPQQVGMNKVMASKKESKRRRSILDASVGEMNSMCSTRSLLFKCPALLTFFYHRCSFSARFWCRRWRKRKQKEARVDAISIERQGSPILGRVVDCWTNERHHSNDRRRQFYCQRSKENHITPDVSEKKLTSCQYCLLSLGFIGMDFWLLFLVADHWYDSISPSYE